MKLPMHRAVVAIGIGIGLFAQSSAAGVAVYDATANTQLYKQLYQAYLQVNLLRSQYEAIKGAYGMGNLKQQELNKVVEQMPPSWREVVSLQRSKGQMRQADYYRRLLQVIEKNVFQQGDRQSSAIRLSQDNTHAAFTATDELYAVLGEHQRNVMALTGQIESAPNIKAAMDLNTRLQAELAMVQVSSSRLQVIQNQLKATELNNQNQSTIDRRLNFKYNPAFSYRGGQQ
ncbi:type IV secretion system protein [Chitinimonas sp. BJB300]|uniref:type IV secretion system protein n=1 Tax=Chitinimonas sp. BJB300 TaxID=1559339 RepID=UPI0013044CEE|nr:type IV secretion system protein [Chitinimonas sp. BJB300]